MPKRADKTCVIKNGQEKSCEVDRADDPEPFFELEPGRAHGAFLAAVAIGCKPHGRRFATARGPSPEDRSEGGSDASYFQSDERTNLFPSLSLNIA